MYGECSECGAQVGADEWICPGCIASAHAEYDAERAAHAAEVRRQDAIPIAVGDLVRRRTTYQPNQLGIVERIELSDAGWPHRVVVTYLVAWELPAGASRTERHVRGELVPDGSEA